MTLALYADVVRLDRRAGKIPLPLPLPIYDVGTAQSADSRRQVLHAAFREIWEAVIQDFFERGSPGGLRFSINDGGARPDTVTLRLLQSAQLMETEA